MFGERAEISMEEATERWAKLTKSEREQILKMVRLSLNAREVDNYKHCTFSEIPGNIKRRIAEEHWQANITGLRPSRD